MRIRFVRRHLLPIGPGMARDFREGWVGELPDSLAEDAIAAGVAVVEDAPAPDPVPPEDEGGA